MLPGNEKMCCMPCIILQFGSVLLHIQTTLELLEQEQKLHFKTVSNNQVRDIVRNLLQALPNALFLVPEAIGPDAQVVEVHAAAAPQGHETWQAVPGSKLEHLALEQAQLPAGAVEFLPKVLISTGPKQSRTHRETTCQPGAAIIWTPDAIQVALLDLHPAGMQAMLNSSSNGRCGWREYLYEHKY